MKKFNYLLISLMPLFLIACTATPVADDTMSAEKSFNDVGRIKVTVGEPMPNFTLPDGEGRQVSLSQFKGKQPVMLLFYRGDWCPYCVSQLEDFQSLLPTLDEYNIQLLAISPDNLATTKNTGRKFGSQNYIFMSDIDRKVIDLVGIGSNENLPHPSLFVIDIEGVLRWYYAHVNRKTRPSAQQTMKVLDDLFKYVR